MIRVRHLVLAYSLVHICSWEIKQEADFSVVDIGDYWIGYTKTVRMWCLQACRGPSYIVFWIDRGAHSAHIINTLFALLRKGK